MTEQIKEDVPAFVGVAIGDRVIFNLVDRHGDFPYTGVSIIHALKQNRNKFVADIIQSRAITQLLNFLMITLYSVNSNQTMVSITTYIGRRMIL